MAEHPSGHLGRSDAERQRERAERERRRAGGAQPPPRPQPRPRTGRVHTPRVLAVLALLGVLAAVWIAISRLTSSSRHARAVALPVVVSVLIPEGETRRQIAERARTAGLAGSYLRASKHSPLLDPARYGAPPKTPDLEGFLFPATYEMYRGAPASRLVHEQLIAFREHFGARQIGRARALHLTPYQLLIVASMVEREAQLPGDLPKVAAVIYNRLRQGMALGIDATIYYALEQRKGIATYTQELTEAELHINSPYNTRTHTGLPPTPISNPGAAAIRAAAYPAHAPYLYYVAAADGCGKEVFSKTLAEFEVNAAAYQAAVRKNGGRPPVCRHK